MLDDSNAKEMEAALREEEELDVPDGMTPEDWRKIQEEAQAEEEFIADREDTVKPLVFQKKNEDGTVKVIDTRPETHSVDASDGVLGSGDLEVDRVGEPINNEEELRKESADNMDDDPKKTTDDAAEPVVDAPVDDSGLGGDTAAEPATTDSLDDAAPTSEPVAEPEAEAEPVAEEPAAEEAPVVDSMREGVEEAPSADIPAVTDTPTPIPGGMPTSPVTTDAPATASAAEPKKKKKTGLIIGLIVLLLVIIGGVVGGILFYNAHEAPEQQVKDAVANMFYAKTAGATKVAAVESGKLPFIGMSIKSGSTPYGDLSMSFDFALKGTGTFYLKVSGLDVVANAFKEGFMSQNTTMDPDKLINVVKNPIDGKWIAIDVDDDEVKATVSCMSESLNSILSEGFRKKAGAAFEKYPFVKYKKDSKVENRNGVNYYEVEIDEKLQEDFSKELEGAEELKNFEKCTSGFGFGGGSTVKASARLSTATKVEDEDDEDDYDGYIGVDTIEDSDIPGLKNLTEDRTQTIKFGISSWSHELQAVEVVSETKDGKKDTLNFSFRTIAESDLKDAKTIEDIIKEIQTGLPDVIAEYYCESAKEQMGTEEFKQQFPSKQDCIDAAKEQFEDVDLTQMLGGMTMTSAALRKRI